MKSLIILTFILTLVTSQIRKTRNFQGRSQQYSICVNKDLFGIISANFTLGPLSLKVTGLPEINITNGTISIGVSYVNIIGTIPIYSKIFNLCYHTTCPIIANNTSSIIFKTDDTISIHKGKYNGIMKVYDEIGKEITCVKGQTSI